MLAEIAQVAETEDVDLVLVAGDQFDMAAPSPDAERIVYRALLDLAATGAQVVVIAGNHDHGQRLAAVAPLLATHGIHAGALVQAADQGGMLTVRTKRGEVARIALVPFLSRRYIVRADELMGLGADQHAQCYDDRARRLIGHLCGGFSAETVNLVVAHLMVAGGVVGGGEREAHTIFDYAVSPHAFPASAHYVALGHLHRSQQIPGACPVHYSGSPLQLDFGEAADDKVVMLVDAAPGIPAEIRPVRLKAGLRLCTLTGTLDELARQAGTTSEDHLRVVVRGPARAGLADEVRALFPDAVEVRVEAPDRDTRGEARPQRLGRSPHELFAEYLAEQGAEDERVSGLFAELLDEAYAANQA